MSSPISSEYLLSWSDFCSKYKHIRKVSSTEGECSLFGAGDFYMNLETRKRVFVKELGFQSGQELEYISVEVEQLIKWNEHKYLVKFVGCCIKVEQVQTHNQHQSKHSQEQQQPKGSIFLIYQSHRSLQQIANELILSSNSVSQQHSLNINSNNSRTGLSPSKASNSSFLRPQIYYFPESTLNSIMDCTLQFIRLAQKQLNSQVQTFSYKSITLQTINIQRFNQVDQKAHIFFYPFLQTDIIDLAVQGHIGIQDTFVSQNILKVINQHQQQSLTRRVYTNKPNTIKGQPEQFREFTSIQMEYSSPTFGKGNNLSQHNFNDTLSISPQQFYKELLQSLGLMLCKLMLLSVSKDRYIQTRFYKMNQSYNLEIDFNTVKQSLLQIKANNTYSKTLTSKVQTLIFHSSHTKNLSEMTQILSAFQQRSKSPISNPRKSNQKVKIQPKKSINLTPSKKIAQEIKKIGLQATRLMNMSKKQLNSTIKEKRIFINEPLKSKTKSVQKTNQSKSKSNLLPQSKTSSIQKRRIREFSPSTVPVKTHLNSNSNSHNQSNSHGHHHINIANHTSSSKKPFQTTISQPQPSKFSTHPNISPHHQQLIESLKRKILYDHSGNIHPNIIEKSFRDGSTYIGQYNPHLNIKQGNGLYFYHEGDIYGGNWKNDQLNGLGIYIFANGDTYQGQVINGQKHGTGTYCYANGNKYHGEWKDDKKQGKGQFYYANGDSYTGDFVQGKKQGYGTYKWVNGDTYEGFFAKNTKHGQGKFKKSNHQDILQGVWQNDKLSQQLNAKITYQTNKTYQGHILSNGIIDGKGKYTFGQNSYYEGQIKQNTYDGECFIKFENGDTYKGGIRNNLFEGFGEYYFSSKKFTYVGQWHQGLQHGKGKIIFDQNGTTIHAKWQKGQYSVHKGVIEYSSQDRYQGDINQRGRHGRGKYFFKNGKWIDAQFQDNQLIHVYTSSEHK